MVNGASKMMIASSEEDYGAALHDSDSFESAIHAGNELDFQNMEAAPEQDIDNPNSVQAVNERLNEIMDPTGGRGRVEIENLPSEVDSGEFGFFPADQVSTDAAPAFEWDLGPWVLLNNQAELDADETEALLLDLNPVQAERNEDEAALALLFALGSAVGLARQLGSAY